MCYHHYSMVIVDVIKDGRESAVARACDVLERGGIAAFPTETFYALGVRYDNEAALRRLYAVKHRPSDKAIPLIIGSMAMLPMVAAPAVPLVLKLTEGFWPGPLTILLDARADISSFITAGTGKVAVRIPGSSLALDIARAVSFPVTATSANISGTPPSNDPREVAASFRGAIDLMVDGGMTPGGRPSTIIEIIMGKAALLREGVIPFEEITGFVER